MKRILESCARSALALAVMQATRFARTTTKIEGVGQTQVCVYNCANRAAARDAATLYRFMHDGSITETGVNIMPTANAGTWKQIDENASGVTYWFYRHSPGFTVALLARADDNIVLNGDDFEIAGSVTDTFPEWVDFQVGRQYYREATSVSVAFKCS
jgi:hypothetical protein